MFQIGMGASSTLVFPHNFSSYTGNNIWGPLCFIATGCLSFYASTLRSFQYIKLAFAMNISNIFLSCVGITLNSLDGKDYRSSGYHYTNGNKETSSVLMAFLILMNVLHIVLSIPILISGYQSLKCNSTGNPQVYFIPHNVASLRPPPYSSDPLIFIEDSPSQFDNNN
ncbi:hypothetical protein GDO81_023553 [Engystomops pustulosus]|uniref:Uncharacterized protein n=1 Tax=Engystomops pustulosus TaxID=76066 RepID=A0AAV6Z4E8_ENGPU|nr:hypothetical protein GDO81_023553 [Engystomops pustulosus]